MFSRGCLNFWLVVYCTLYAFMLPVIFYNGPKPFKIIDLISLYWFWWAYSYCVNCFEKPLMNILSSWLKRVDFKVPTLIYYSVSVKWACRFFCVFAAWVREFLTRRLLFIGVKIHTVYLYENAFILTVYRVLKVWSSWYKFVMPSWTTTHCLLFKHY